MFFLSAAKAVVAATIPLFVAIGLWLATGKLDAEEYGLLVLAVVESVAVYQTPNRPRRI